jgi:hypothetical protein
LDAFLRGAIGLLTHLRDQFRSGLGQLSEGIHHQFRRLGLPFLNRFSNRLEELGHVGIRFCLPR